MFSSWTGDERKNLSEVSLLSLFNHLKLVNEGDLQGIFVRYCCRRANPRFNFPQTFLFSLRDSVVNTRACYLSVGSVVKPGDMNRLREEMVVLLHRENLEP